MSRDISYFALFNDNCHLPCNLVPFTMHFWSNASCTIARLPFLVLKYAVARCCHANKRSCECVKQIHIMRALYATHAWWVNNFSRLQRNKFWLNMVSFVLLKKIYLTVKYKTNNWCFFCFVLFFVCLFVFCLFFVFCFVFCLFFCLFVFFFICAMVRLVEWNISSFTSWKYVYHCTHKHSLFVYFLIGN